MVLAKNKEMAKYLGEKFKSRDIYKAYYALICGIPSLPRGIVRQSYDKKEMLWEIETLDAQRTIHKSPDYSAEIVDSQLDMITKYEVISVSQMIDGNWANKSYEEVRNDYQASKPTETYSYVKFVIETGKKH